MPRGTLIQELTGGFKSTREGLKQLAESLHKTEALTQALRDQGVSEPEINMMKREDPWLLAIAARLKPLVEEYGSPKDILREKQEEIREEIRKEMVADSQNAVAIYSGNSPSTLQVNTPPAKAGGIN